jgi:four helix bundle protein
VTALHYAELDVWRVVIELAEDIYRFIRTLPAEKRFGLCSQFRRAGISLPSNIAEGNGRDTTKDYAGFVSMARGSFAEIETQLILTSRIGIRRRRTM